MIHPFTRQPLHPYHLNENEELKQEIEEWREQHNVPIEEEDDDDENDESESDFFPEYCEGQDVDCLAGQEEDREEDLGAFQSVDADWL